MIALDTNILVYAHRAELPAHALAYAAVRQLCEEARDWAIPWPCVHEFFATVTHSSRFEQPSTAAQALAQVDAWLQAPGVRLLAESQRHWQTVSELIRSARLAGGAVHDARIAAICIDHSVAELWTADRDFRRFPQLRCRNPLNPNP